MAPFTGDPTHVLPIQAGATFVSAYSTDYQQAREGIGAVVSEYPWIGQYNSGYQYEVNQVMTSFSTASLSGSIVEARLVLNVVDSYGQSTLEVRKHDWIANDPTSFVAGSNLASKTLHGTYLVSPGTSGEIVIGLENLGSTDPLKFVFCISDQTNNVAPIDDNTILISDARLEIRSRRMPRSTYIQ